MAPSLLDQVVQATVAAAHSAATVLDQLRAAPTRGARLALWLGLAPGDPVPSGAAIRARLAVDLARLDALLSAQVDAILHHPRFQELEAAWRGVALVVEAARDVELVKVRLLHASWRELARDLGGAIEFDQSQLFRKVYSAEFGSPGGEPFGLLVGDFAVRHAPEAGHPIDDVATLAAAAQVAAAAFAPLLVGAAPSLLGLESFADLERPIDVARPFAQPDHLAWNTLRRSPDARFLGVCLPRVLLRRPWRDDPARADGFRYEEDAAAPDRSGYLWGNAAFALAAVVIRAVGESGLPIAMRGLPADGSGGRVDDLAIDWISTETHPRVAKPVTEVAVSDAREQELVPLGLMPLCHVHGDTLAAFHAAPSLQQPATFDDPTATANARISSMLHYILCVSRFAHHLKVMARDRVGSLSTPEEWEAVLNRWLRDYSNGNPNAGYETLARQPLREARAKVEESPGKPGSYRCVIHLCPHFQLDQMAASVRLETELVSATRQ